MKRASDIMGLAIVVGVFLGPALVSGGEKIPRPGSEVTPIRGELYPHSQALRASAPTLSVAGVARSSW